MDPISFCKDLERELEEVKRELNSATAVTSYLIKAIDKTLEYFGIHGLGENQKRLVKTLRQGFSKAKSHQVYFQAQSKDEKLTNNPAR